MPMCKILVSYPNAEGWKIGDIVDITAPDRLIEEGKVELYVGKVKEEKIDDNNTDSPPVRVAASRKKSK